jgi:hypothetical protein
MSWKRNFLRDVERVGKRGCAGRDLCWTVVCEFASSVVARCV